MAWRIGMDESRTIDWVQGEASGLVFPTHPDALRAAGPDFLTQAFHSTGILSADNAVVRVTAFEDCSRGSTGRKVLLSVEYRQNLPGLHRELFVKFSRDFDDALRDQQRYEMAREVQFAHVSCRPGFPVNVAACYFADFHGQSGSGILITQRVRYGEDPIEPHYEKCLDREMPDALAHYQALISANAQLAGQFHAGLLPEAISTTFPFDAHKAAAADPIRYDERQIRNRIARFADFCRAYPGLFPENIRTAEFHARLHAEAPRFLQHEKAIKQWLYGRPEYIVFCHWNANVDNAWFWRDAKAGLRCGLIDWGGVGQMNVASALWGSLSGAEWTLWDAHFDHLLELFCSEFARAGGGILDPCEVGLQLEMLVGLLGLCWLLDAVPLILRELPDLDVCASRDDDGLRNNERARTQLHMLTVFLNLWDSRDLGRSLTTVLRRLERGAGQNG